MPSGTEVPLPSFPVYHVGHGKDLADFTYSDGDIGDVMTQSMASVDFLGVMGAMNFKHNGDPPRIIAIDQQQGEVVFR